MSPGSPASSGLPIHHFFSLRVPRRSLHELRPLFCYVLLCFSMFCYVSAMFYAQTSILVNLILVNFFGFLVITRYHERFGGCHLVEIFPTDLPELSKPKCSRNKSRKNNFLGLKNLRSGITF